MIPNAGVKWYETIRNAGGVIVENGGALSHLAVVGLEEGFLVALVENAREIYNEGMLVAMDSRKGIIEIMANISRREQFVHKFMKNRQ